jgi:hypothetical protein
MSAEDQETDHSDLAQYRRVINAIVNEGSTARYLLLDGFLHSEDCTSLWKFSEARSARTVEIEQRGGEEPIINLYGSGVEVYLLHKLGHGKLLEQNERLGRGEDPIAECLDTDGRPLVQSIQGRHLLTARLINLGKRSILSARDPELIPVDQSGMSAMLHSLPLMLEARAKGAKTRIPSDQI